MKLYEEDSQSIKKDLAEIKEALPKLFAFAKELSDGIGLLIAVEKEKIALTKQMTKAFQIMMDLAEPAKEDKTA